jgi:pimeloyl-ACP methyl ester carboxylesterase
MKRISVSWMRGMLFMGAGLVASLSVGAAYNALQNWNLNRIHPVPGKMHLIDGSSMHIYCIGNTAPTVILESGIGNDWLIWQKVQRQISKTNRVCSYDRAGIGWSPARSGSRGALAIAEQLNALLRVAGIHGPLVLVGHSAGGLYIRAFAGMFPEEVAGLILVDASSPEAFRELPSPALRKKLIAERHRKAPWMYFRVVTGISRLSGDYCNPNTSQRIPAVEDLARAEDCRPSYVNSWLGEWDDFESSAEQVSKLPCCKSVPLVVLSEDSGLANSSEQKGGGPTWDSVQQQLTHLSSRSMRIVAKNSGHYVMVDRPDVVLDAVRIVDHEVLGLPDGIRNGLVESR